MACQWRANPGHEETSGISCPGLNLADSYSSPWLGLGQVSDLRLEHHPKYSVGY